MAADDGIWNFAYGSNMDPKTRDDRHWLEVREVVPARVEGWRLAFNLRGFRWTEPAMAGIEPDPQDEVHGVLLRLGAQGWQMLQQHELAGFLYDVVDVPAIAADGRTIVAKAFRTCPDQRCVPDRPPSERYLAKIRAGAVAAGLSDDWCRRLGEVEPFQPRGARRVVRDNLDALARAAVRHGKGDLLNRYTFTARRCEDLPRPVEALALLPGILIGGALRPFYGDGDYTLGS